jgi:Ca-activated chloride channel homolog
MKKITVLILLVGLFSLGIFAQAGRSRPRVVTTENTSTPPNQPSNSEAEPTNSPTNESTPTKRPPVLINDTKPANDTTEVVEDDEVIKVETNLVTIPVTVLDRDGRFISGLQQGDFQVYEDGAAQKIEYFASLETPFTVVLLLDVSESTKFKIDEIQDAAITFVRQLRKNDKVMVISFAEKIKVLTPPTNNRGVLENAIRQIRFDGGTSLYEAVSYTINQELRRVEGRKAIVLFTDGVDTTSRRDTYLTTIKEAEEIDAMIYPIRFDTLNDGGGNNNSGGNYPTPSRRKRNGNGGWGQILGTILSGGNVSIGNGGGNTGRTQSEYENGRRYLEDLATVTGGRKFEAKTINNLDAAFSGIAEELRRQYSIGYYPEKEGKKGQRKQVKVRVVQSNAVVRAKNSYIVGQNSSNNTTAKQPARPAPKAPARLPF